MTLTEAKQFVTLWYESPTIDAVCAATGLDRRAVQNRRAGLVRRGVELDVLPGRPAGQPHANGAMTAEEYHELKRWAAACRAARAMKKYRQS